MAKGKEVKLKESLDLTKFLEKENTPFFRCETLNWKDTEMSGLVLFVDGKRIGRLHEINYDDLQTLAVQSPFGKGKETVIDTSVRNGFEISAERMTWQFESEGELRKSTDKEVGQIFQTALPGVPATNERNTTVKLYKLHLYRVGGFFDTHVDTVHADNHIATQILVLPSLHKGGELHVMHDGREIVFDSSEAKVDPLCVTHSCSFFTDCEHKVKPVTQGLRAILQFDTFASKNNAHSQDEDEDQSNFSFGNDDCPFDRYQFTDEEVDYAPSETQSDSKRFKKALLVHFDRFPMPVGIGWTHCKSSGFDRLLSRASTFKWTPSLAS